MPAGPIQELDGAPLIRALCARMEANPRAAFDEFGPLLAGEARIQPEREALLRATCGVLGNDLIVYPHRKQTRDVLREAPL